MLVAVVEGALDLTQLALEHLAVRDRLRRVEELGDLLLDVSPADPFSE